MTMPKLDSTDGHILVSFLILLVGVGLVIANIEYGKELVSMAGGWMGRSMMDAGRGVHVKLPNNPPEETQVKVQTTNDSGAKL